MAEWRMQGTLDSQEYYPLQTGLMSNVTLKNARKEKIVIIKTAIIFDWMPKDKYFFTDCNIKAEPSENVELPDVPFKIHLEAPIGTQMYKIGIVYKVLEKASEETYYWGDPKTGWVYVGKHVIIKKPSKRDFEVFISHSNTNRDTKLLDIVVDLLDKCGLKTFVAERKPIPGYPLWQKIEAAIRRADAILILWTEDGSNSGDVREEIGISMGAKKISKIIPLVQVGLTTHGCLIGLEHIPLDVENQLPAISIAAERAIEWADEKEVGRPKVAST